MSKDQKTPQAFPYSGEGDEMNYSKGMTLRDYFAAQAIGQCLAACTHMKAAAQEAYMVADEMLKARKQ